MIKTRFYGFPLRYSFTGKRDTSMCPAGWDTTASHLRWWLLWCEETIFLESEYKALEVSGSDGWMPRPCRAGLSAGAGIWTGWCRGGPTGDEGWRYIPPGCRHLALDPHALICRLPLRARQVRLSLRTRPIRMAPSSRTGCTDPPFARWVFACGAMDRSPNRGLGDRPARSARLPKATRYLHQHSA